MEDLLTRFFNDIGLRVSGPMKFRFILQPLMSLIYAVIAGVRDAKKGNEPFFKALVTQKENRKALYSELWKDVGKVFIIAIIMDTAYQLIMIYSKEIQEGFHPLEVLITAFVLALVPYIIFRGPINRIVRMFIKKEDKPN
jgi:hypothetical protein